MLTILLSVFLATADAAPVPVLADTSIPTDSIKPPPSESTGGKGGGMDSIGGIKPPRR